VIDQLDVVGPFRGPSGYDRITREFVRALVARGVRVQLTNLDGWSAPMPEGMRDMSFERLDAPTGADTVLQFVMPTHVQPRPGARNVDYTMFEAETLPPSWAYCARHADLIVVPAPAGHDTWTNSGVPADRVRVAPLAVDGAFFSGPAEPLPLALPDGRPVASFGTRFMHIGELRARKNQLGLLRAWLHATSRDDDAVLILKCPAVPRMVARLGLDVLDMQRELGRSLGEAAPILLLPALLSDQQMLSLYASATHYISMSCGEGWDEVMMEAAVAGLHLITPRHTAYLEYLQDGDAEFIPAPLAPAELRDRLAEEDVVRFEGLRWWAPDEEAAAEIIRGAINGRRALQDPPSERLASTYTWESAARRLLEVLDAD
jgi:glycosyltransferase involved in cell wall biosynthesis